MEINLKKIFTYHLWKGHPDKYAIYFNGFLRGVNVLADFAGINKEQFVEKLGNVEIDESLWRVSGGVPLFSTEEVEQIVDWLNSILMIRKLSGDE